MSNTLVRPDDTNLSPSRMSDGISKDAAAIPAVNPTADGRSDSVRKFAEPPPAAPPARTSRRAFMNSIVTLPIIAAIPTSAPVMPTRDMDSSPAASLTRAITDAPDPIFAAIAAPIDPAFTLAEKRAADVAHCNAIDAEGEFEKQGDVSSDAALAAQDDCEAACHLANEVDWRLATTPPATLAGVAGVLRFANEIIENPPL